MNIKTTLFLAVALSFALMAVPPPIQAAGLTALAVDADVASLNFENDLINFNTSGANSPVLASNIGLTAAPNTRSSGGTVITPSQFSVVAPATKGGVASATGIKPVIRTI